MAGCNQFAGLCFDCLSADRDKHRLHADTDAVPCMSALYIPVHNLSVSAFLPVCRFLRHLLLIALPNYSAATNLPIRREVYSTLFFIGLGSLLFPQLLYFVPLFYLGMISFRSPVLKSFFAGLTGLCVPYWLFFRLCVLLRQNESLLSPFTELIHFQPISYGTLGMDRIISCGIITLISLVSSVHYFHVSYLDKVRTRIFLFFLITVEAWIYLLGILQPQHFDILLQMQIIVGSILTGHLFTLTHNPLPASFFIITFVLLIVLTIYNLWMQFFNS